LRVVQRHDRRCVSGGEIRVALDVALRLLKRGLRAIDDGLHPLHVGFDLPAIEREQQVTFLHRRAITEMNSGNRCIDLRLDRDTGDRRDVAEGSQTDRHGLAFSNRGLDRNGAGLWGARGGAVRGPDATSEHNNANQGDDCPAKEPFSLDHRQFSVRTHLGLPGRSLIRGMACFTSIWGRVSALLAYKRY
jgi:hypothetical protein